MADNDLVIYTDDDTFQIVLDDDGIQVVVDAVGVTANIVGEDGISVTFAGNTYTFSLDPAFVPDFTSIIPLTIGDILYASSTTEIAALHDVATGNALISGGVGVAPNWGKVTLTGHVSGVLPAASGGTGVANSNTITLGGNVSTAGAFTTAGAYSLTLTATAATNVTLPTTGTLVTRAGIETLSNKTLAAPSITGVASFGPTTGERIYLYDGGAGASRAGLGIDLTGGSRELGLFTASSDGSNGSLSFGYRLESTGVYTERVRMTNAGLKVAAYGAGTLVSDSSGNITTTGSLSVASGKTLTASNTLTLTGTDGSSVAFGAGGTVIYSGGAAGTPSSITLTNGTGLPLTTGVTGRLPFANLTQGAALTVLANATNGTADFAALAAASDHQVLRRSGTALAFGAVNLAQSAAVTGTLPVGNGGTGITALGTGVATALGINGGSAGAFVTFNGAGGTPSSLTLTNATGLPVSGITASTSTALGVGSIELGHASDTTLSRSSAGVLAVEGVTIPLNAITSIHTAQQIELGHASDTTITRVSAGLIAVEGVNVLLNGGALGTPSSATLTNATGLPVGGHAAQAAYTFIGNNTGSSATPTAVDIAALTSKASPAAGDYVMLSDQAASGAWKKATVSSVASAGSVASIAGNTGAFTLSYGITNSTNDIRLDASFLPNYLSGLTLANNGSDATNDIDIATGAAADSGNSVLMKLGSALTKRLDASWAVGTNQGGLDTGSIANTTYHIWLIQRSDTGVVDALFSTSVSAPTMPTNYDRKRRIGSIVRASSAIRAFVQVGDKFDHSVPPFDVNANNPGTSAVLASLSVPGGLIVEAEFSVALYDSSPGSSTAVMVTSPLVPDTAPAGGYGALYLPNSGATVANAVSSRMRVLTDTSGRVRYRLESSNASKTFTIATFGWIDRRGKDG